METQLQCVIFDLDDTLYLERDYVHSGFQAVDHWCAEALGLSGVGDLAQEYFDAGGRGNIFDVVLGRLRVQNIDETVKAMVHVYREHTPTISLVSDAVRCLSALKGNVRLGLLTDGNSVTQREKIRALGIRDTFEEIVVTGDWGVDFFKPNPRGFRHLEDRFRLPSAQFTYVADNPSKDFTAPRELRWKTVRVKRPGGLYSQRLCPTSLAQVEIENLEGLPEIITRLR